MKALVDISGSNIPVPIPIIQIPWEEKPFAQGGFGCVRRGKLHGKQYVLKTLHPTMAYDPIKTKVIFVFLM